MFAYCGNNPVLLCDTTGTFPEDDLNLFDYLIIHILVQTYVAIELGLYPEVYVKGPLGKGFLDLYDKDSHSYYEVTSKNNANSSRKIAQIAKYNAANQMGLPVYTTLTDIPELQGGTEPIDSYFIYRNYSIHYWLEEPGLILYNPEKLATKQGYSIAPKQSFLPVMPPQSERKFATIAVLTVCGGASIALMLTSLDSMQRAR